MVAKTRKLTIRDVAKKAGVGIGTVSRVLNNSPKVTAATREMVLEVVRELGFKPHSGARQLPRKTRVQNIGVITQPFINYRAFSERLRGIQAMLGETHNEYELVVYSVSSLEHYATQVESILRTGWVEGLIIIDLDLTDPQIEQLHNTNIPFVGINHFKNRNWVCIGTDNEQGGYLAAKHLIDLGHERIAYIGDLFELPLGFNTTSYERFKGLQHATHQYNASVDRLGGLQQAVQENAVSIPHEYVRLCEHDYNSAYQATTELMQLPEPPTAIFAMSDMQALACIRALREQGWRVPEDISVVGYDDLEVSYHTNLTTVRQHLDLTGRVALEYLLRVLAGEKDVIPTELPPLEVIVRQTTAPRTPR